MPGATILPTSNVVIRFPPAPTGILQAEESYQLLELPAEILKRVEGSKEPLPLTIKGRPSDDAVLCTPDSTFTLRTVSISNSLLVLRPPSTINPNTTSSFNEPISSLSTTSDPFAPSSSSSNSRSTLQIRDVCHQVLECIPSAPKLERIRTVLRESAWEGLSESSNDNQGGFLGKRRRQEFGEDEKGGRRKRYTRAQLESIIQASEKELEKGLKDKNVIELNGRMLLLPSTKLQPLLTIILTLLTIHADQPTTTKTDENVYTSVKVNTIISALEEHEVNPDLALGVMGLFGCVKEDGEEKEQVWLCDTRRVVKFVGMGMLESLKGENKPSNVFLDDWKTQVGESWENLVDLSLLAGEHILTNPPASALFSSAPLITPFPSHALSLHPATRFSDLFLTRSKWRPHEMEPFLNNLTREGDTKERDKLIAKFVRVVKEKDGTWWFPRRSA